LIDFNVPFVTGRELENFEILNVQKKYSGDGLFTKKCSSYLQSKFGVHHALLTTSCTHALEMCALLIDIKPGDEVIMPSFTFVSTANAFVLRGAKIVFVDIEPHTLNIDDTKIENAINEKTRALVVVHYAGASCNMNNVRKIADKYKLVLIEDAAQAIHSKFNDKYLGTYGDLSTFSFHETKNIHCGEGGVLLINNPIFVNHAEIIREKGTDRSLFLKGLVDKYTWRKVGSSYLLSELNAAFLLPQLEQSENVISRRSILWNKYYSKLSDCKKLQLLNYPKEVKHNAHIFLIILESNEIRDSLMKYLKTKGITAVFHYLPLHKSPAGNEYGTFIGEDRYTSDISDRLLRLPLHLDLEEKEVEIVCNIILDYLDRY
jgi:dTDP-4-amino-4,6-dideoxygalactose transaminase